MHGLLVVGVPLSWIRSWLQTFHSFPTEIRFYSFMPRIRNNISVMWNLMAHGDTLEYVILCTCICTLPRACICWDLCPSQTPRTEDQRNTAPGQERKELLKWQPLCIFYEICLLTCLYTSTKLFHCCFEVHLVSLSCLGSFYLACLPSSTFAPLPLASACPDSSICGALLSFLNTSVTTYFFVLSLTNTSAPAQSTPGRQEGRPLPGSLFLPSPRGRSKH